MKVTRPKFAAGFTLVEIMIVVLIIGILLAIAIPNFVQARESSRAKACIANMKQIDSAVQQYMMDNKLASGGFTSDTQAAAPSFAFAAKGLALVGTTGYIRQNPLCPSSGLYTTGDGGTARPSCSIGTNATNPLFSHVLP